MEKQLICQACKNKIDIKKDSYTHIEDYNKLKIVGESWWHISCFKKAMNKDLTVLEKQASFMLKKANNIFNKLPKEFGGEEEYVLTWYLKKRIKGERQ